jgi:DNA-binding transcriptional ArsR family regulator
MNPIPWKIRVSPRFELFLALWSALSDKARRHGEWRRLTRERLSPEFHRAIAALGGCPELWILFFDAPGLRPPEDEIGQVLAHIRRRPAAELAEGLLSTLLHSETIGARIFARELGVPEALAALPRRKREWLGFMGLYPYVPARPMAKAVARMIEDPHGFRRDALAALDSFVASAFAADWRRLKPQLEQSVDRIQPHLREGDWQTVGRRLGLNIEFDLARRQMRALRGGYALPFDKLGEAIFLPSAFNELQFWTVLDQDSGETDPLIPYLDPAVRLTLQPSAAEETAPPRDVALVFRALGDATRFALAGLLARRPMSSAELGRQLGLSKPTVAHHVHELRQAGLLNEQSDGKAVILSLDRTAIDMLSAATAAQLFDASEAPALLRSRRPA